MKESSSLAWSWASLGPEAVFVVMIGIEITINGEKREIPPAWTVGDLITDLDLPNEQIAVEVNDEIISRTGWRKQFLSSGDQVEIVHFVGGGVADV